MKLLSLVLIGLIVSFSSQVFADDHGTTEPAATEEASELKEISDEQLGSAAENTETGSGSGSATEAQKPLKKKN